MKFVYTSGFLLLLALKVHGQFLACVHDINPLAGSNPHDLVIYKNKLFFIATSDKLDIWQTDGSSTGTSALNTNLPLGVEPQALTVCGDKLFFAAGVSLYVTNGTTSGTIKLASFKEYFHTLYAVDSLLFFAANDSVHGTELWVSDGTIAGTRLVKDIFPGTHGGAGGGGGACYNHKLFFSAQDSTGNDEIWTSDGTATGTFLVKDINPSGAGSPTQFFVFNGKLYFRGIDSSTNAEPWVSNGTAQGTHVLKELVSNGGSWPTAFTSCGGKLIFGAFLNSSIPKLHFSDGTDTGTHSLSGNSPRSVVFFNNIFHLAINTNSGDNGLWTTDGTDAGTHPLFTSLTTPGSTIWAMTVFDNKLIIIANDGTNGNELWLSDGTTTNTIKPVFNNANGHNPFPTTGSNEFVEYNGSLYFSAAYNNGGSELWKFSLQPLEVGVQNSKHESFSIYPNPAGTSLNVVLTRKQALCIRDIFGHVIIKKYFEKSSCVDISELVTGLYFISSEGDSSSVKFLKQ